MNLQEKKVGLIGAGAMGSAIGLGLIESTTISPSKLFICDHNLPKLEPFKNLGAKVFLSADEFVSERFDIVILAVKPQVLPALLTDIKGGLSASVVVSIAAGVTLLELETALPTAHILRAMPNLPIQVRQAAVALAKGTRASDEDVRQVLSLFAPLGEVRLMREDQLDIEGAVVGCAPAYFALVIDAFTRASVRAGLSAEASRALLVSTMQGVATQLSSQDIHPRIYMERVTSPGGTTAAGLHALESSLMHAADEAVCAALMRTHELAHT